ECQRIFPQSGGLIAAAAPCDYRPVRVQPGKIHKTGAGLDLHLEETPDIIAALAEGKRHQWFVGFALETEDQRFRAIVKLERKSCDLMVVNGPEAMHALDNRVEILNRAGDVLATLSGPKEQVSQG